MKGWSGIALAALLACGTAPGPSSPPAPAPSVSSPPSSELREGPEESSPVAALRALVESRRIDSVEELLPLLPESLRARHVLVYESGSVQPATYRSPRVLLYTADARFVATFNGEPELPGYRSLETVEFDDARRAFRFREVSFPSPSEPAVFSEPNPQRCLACHGEDPRPIWDTYPTWPGVYRGQDHTAPSRAEAAGFAAFLEGRDASPRYRTLVSVEASLAPTAPASAAYEGRARFSRNAEFGALLQGLALRAVAREVTGAPAFAPYRYALLAALDAQCLDIEGFVPERLRRSFGRSLVAFARETDAANAAADDAKRRRMPGAPAAESALPRETLTPFRFLAEEGLHLSTRGWTLAPEKSTYDFTSPLPASRVLERELLQASGDSSLPALRDLGEHRDAYCATLRKRSLAALGP